MTLERERKAEEFRQWKRDLIAREPEDEPIGIIKQISERERRGIPADWTEIPGLGWIGY